VIARFSKNQEDNIATILQLNLADRPQAIAEMVHLLQFDKADNPYIGHPRRVSFFASLMISELTDLFSAAEEEVAVQAAWLHDVLEDSGTNGFPQIFSDDLIGWGVSQEVLDVVLLLSKDGSASKVDEPSADQSYMAIKANKLARLVKIADLADNCNKQRVAILKTKGVKDKVPYYTKATEFLNLDSKEREMFDSRVDMDVEITKEAWIKHNSSWMDWDKDKPVIPGRMSFSQLYRKARAESDAKNGKSK
jgi:(p)ppGpp synthase/HD superfamily hydrolase